MIFSTRRGERTNWVCWHRFTPPVCRRKPRWWGVDLGPATWPSVGIWWHCAAVVLVHTRRAGRRSDGRSLPH